MLYPPDRHAWRIPLLLGLLLLHGCAGNPARFDLPPDLQARRIAELDNAILGLGAGVDRDESRRAAQIAIEYSRQLADEYEVSGSALYHNLMINLGFKERGLCVDWTADLLARLREERFRSLDLHWAIANYTSVYRLEHSTVIISAAGDPLQQGIVLDPWRNSGDLFWAPTLADIDYPWRPRADIHALKRAQRVEAESRPLYR